LNDLFAKARSLRVTKGQIPSGINLKLTVFIGIYNGDKFISKIIKQLTSQIDQDFLIVAVDNNSKDSSWEKLQTLLDVFPDRVIIAKNPFNLGAAGSLSLSIDLIQTEWWCAFHQDDDYKSNYVRNFNQIIYDVNEEVVSISAEMGSITNTGRRTAVPPRSSWLIKRPDPISTLIANLRVQTVPYPATAFRTDVYRQCISPWHSTAFSDTESTIAMLEFGNFVFSGTHTMNYRENEMSESHSINNHESLIATGTSLARIFSSSAFTKVIKKVEIADRANFLEAVNNSIEVRLGNSEFSKFIKYIAAENCMIVWGYSEEYSINQVRSYFNDSGSSFTPQLLSRILNFIDPSSQDLEVLRSPFTTEFLNSFLGSQNLNVNLKNRNLSFARRIYNFMMNWLPHVIQKRIGKILLKVRIFLSSKHPWDFKWQ